jgi:alpha-beta hydrolase superfamily lysophospholipase
MSTRRFNGAAYIRVETDPLLSGVDVDPNPTLSTPCRCYWAVCACSFLVLVLPWLYFFLVKTTTGMAVGQFVTINDVMVQQFCHDDLTMGNVTYNTWWPGCLYEKPRQNCTNPCYNVSILESMDAFNNNYPGRLVTYQSRPGTNHNGSPIDVIELQGWWLPAPNESAAPRIVLQHGFTQNSNTHSQQLTAYMLRSLGFSVFLPNFRDHCYSGNTSEHIYQWSNAYPLDLLGAWDYVVADPDGSLGGQRDARQVGLQGFSEGAFVISVAFGLESRAPAAWLDSGPWTPRSLFERGARWELEEMGLGFAASALTSSTWENVKKAALEKGVDLDWQLPQQTLPHGPDTKRPMYIVANEDDETVPYSEHLLLKEFLAKYPEKYTVVDWVSTGVCHGSAHHQYIFSKYEEYKDRLCSFWAEAFNIDTSYCFLP